jgi:Lhr-like helicase
MEDAFEKEFEKLRTDEFADAQDNEASEPYPYIQLMQKYGINRVISKVLGRTLKEKNLETMTRKEKTKLLAEHIRGTGVDCDVAVIVLGEMNEKEANIALANYIVEDFGCNTWWVFHTFNRVGYDLVAKNSVLKYLARISSTAKFSFSIYEKRALQEIGKSGDPELQRLAEDYTELLSRRHIKWLESQKWAV